MSIISRSHRRYSSARPASSPLDLALGRAAVDSATLTLDRRDEKSFAALRMTAALGRGHLFPRVVGGAGKRTGLHVGEAEAETDISQLVELRWSVVPRDRQVTSRRAKVLSEGHDVDVAAT